MSIGDNIRQARGQIKQSELADMLGVDVSTISRWENNKNVPHGSVLSDIARVLNTSTEFLLSTSSSSQQDANNKASAQNTNNDTDTDILITEGIANNMFIINDRKSDRVYYLPNNEEGRNLFLTILASGINGTNLPVLSNSINGDNNNGNKLGVINN